MWILEVPLPSSPRAQASFWGGFGVQQDLVLQERGQNSGNDFTVVTVCKPWVCASLPGGAELRTPHILQHLASCRGKGEGGRWVSWRYSGIFQDQSFWAQGEERAVLGTELDDL